MKIRRIVSALFAVLLLGAVIFVTVASAADEADAKVSSPVSVPFDVIAAVGTYTGNVPWAHGNNQTRLVNVSSGTYLGILTGDSYTTPNMGLTYTMSLIRILPDGKTTELLYTDAVYGTSTTISVMADKDENVWFYSGYANQNGKFHFNVWEYDVTSAEIKAFPGIKKPKGVDLGYSVAFIDPVVNKIYAVTTTGGDAIAGTFCWCTFDISTGEWGNPVSFKEHDRYGYEFGYGDGKGGFYVTCEKDGPNNYIMSNIDGLYVSDAMKQLRSRKIDANFMWDEGHLIYIPDASSADYQNFVIEPAVYDVEKGIYPNWYNGSCDLLTGRSDGLVYALANQDDNGVPGRRSNIFVYDPNGFTLLAETELDDLYPEESYSQRFFEDAEGNKYLVRSCDKTTALEIWSLTFENGQIETKLVAFEEIGGAVAASGNKGTFFISESRGNSVPSDIAHCIISADNSYHYFEIDFAAIRAAMH